MFMFVDTFKKMSINVYKWLNRVKFVFSVRIEDM